MSVIIRLQGLPWTASAMNIRHFFSGLNIPAGGVHIIGGEGGDAFIAFASDDDARMAMKRNMCPLMGTPVQLFLSSKSEMQSVIEAARSGSTTAASANVSGTNVAAVPGAMPAAAAAAAGQNPGIPNQMQGMGQGNMAGIGGANIQQLQQQQQQQQHALGNRQGFQNLPGAYPMDNQAQNFRGDRETMQAQQQGQGMSFGKPGWQQGNQMFSGGDQQQHPGGFGGMQQGGMNNTMRDQFGNIRPGANQFPDGRNPMQNQGPGNMNMMQYRNQQSGMNAQVRMPGMMGQNVPQGHQGSGDDNSNQGSDKGIGELSNMQNSMAGVGRGAVHLLPDQRKIMDTGPRDSPGLQGDSVRGTSGDRQMTPGSFEGMGSLNRDDRMGRFGREAGDMNVDGSARDSMQTDRWGRFRGQDNRFPDGSRPFDPNMRQGDGQFASRDGRMPFGGPMDGGAMQSNLARDRLSRAGSDMTLDSEPDRPAGRSDIPHDSAMGGTGREPTMMNRFQREPLIGRTGREPLIGRPERDPAMGMGRPDVVDPLMGRTDREAQMGRPERDPLMDRPDRDPSLGRGDRAPLINRPDRDPLINRPDRDPIMDIPPEGDPPMGRPGRDPLLERPGRDPLLGRPEGDQIMGRSEWGPMAGRHERQAMMGRREGDMMGRFDRDSATGRPDDPMMMGRPERDPLTGRLDRDPMMGRLDSMGRGGDSLLGPGNEVLRVGRFGERGEPSADRKPVEGQFSLEGGDSMSKRTRPSRFSDREDVAQGPVKPFDNRTNVTPAEDDLPSTRYPPEDEDFDMDTREDMNRLPPGRFAPGRGRMDEFSPMDSRQQRYPEDELQSRGFPPRDDRFAFSDRYPADGAGGYPRDRRFPEENTRFPEDTGRFPLDRGFDDRFMNRQRFGDYSRDAEGGRMGPDWNDDRGRGGFDNDGRDPMMRPYFRDYEHDRRPFPPEDGVPPERRPIMGNENESGLNRLDGFPGERSEPGQDSWDRFNQERRGPGNVDAFQIRPGHMERGGRGALHHGPMGRGDSNEIRDVEMDRDQRFSGPRRPDWQNRGAEDGERNDFGFGPHGRPVARGAGPAGLNEGPADLDNRFPGPQGADRPPRGRGEMFMGRGRGGPPYGRGRGMEGGETGGRFADVDSRNIPGRPEVHPSPGMADINKGVPGPVPGKGLLGDGPADTMASATTRPGPPDTNRDTVKRELEVRPRRSGDRDFAPGRERRDRDRGRDDRSRGRDRSPRHRHDRDRRRSRSRDRSRDRDSRRSRGRSSSNKDSPRRSAPRSKCVYIKNMPVNISYKDVRRFMQPLEIPYDGLKVINNEKGQRTGEAYVKFLRYDDAQRAVRYSGSRMGEKIVTITSCPETVFEAAIDSQKEVISEEPKTELQKLAEKSTPNENTPKTVRLSNLPPKVTCADVTQFFIGIPISNNGQAINVTKDNAGNSIAFVEFKTDFDCRKALALDGNQISGKPISLTPANQPVVKTETQKDKESQASSKPNPPAGQVRPPVTLAGPSPPVQGQSPSKKPAGSTPQEPKAQTLPSSSPVDNSQSAQETVCVHIQGLPLLATPHDIRQFFSDSQIAMRGINIAHDSRGKPLGEGFVEFKFRSDFEKAIKKDKTSMGRHIVAVKPIGKKEMYERLARNQGIPPPQQHTPPVTQQSEPSQQQQQQHRQSQPVATPGLPPSGPQSTNGQAPPQQRPPGGSDPEMNRAQQEKKLPPLIPSLMGEVGNKPVAQSIGQQPSNEKQQQQQQQQQAQRPSVPVILPGGAGCKSIPPGVLNKDWYYVRCQNFPTNINIADILQFFQQYRPIGESIRLHYSSDGKPTGNAVVGFKTGEEAQMALQRLHLRPCRQNTVSLFPA